ncbi:DUF2087 domain-containing protein [Actinospica durhamensis]|uniref:DUF2087 domain-containing protein n=1 Tax=Actinospica durhamensis TaxID=1508375 RepID=A0A941ESD5_9ACTN|nr:DUF2087 domain-containing protein [Actinospica durhamensis]MBR7837530.1 DUF2087 domain-containing protein [Actinospica durhamensis]
MNLHSEQRPAPDPRQLVAILADTAKLRVFAALTLAEPKSATSADLAATTGLTAREVLKALAGLETAGLVAGPEQWRATPATFRASLEEFNRKREERLRETFHTTEPEKVAVLLAVFDDEGRLTRLPEMKNRERLMIVLEELAQYFEPGVRYAEAEVNLTLTRFHADYAALRRYLVDSTLLTRAEGYYWRSGGAVQV